MILKGCLVSLKCLMEASLFGDLSIKSILFFREITSQNIQSCLLKSLLGSFETEIMHFMPCYIERFT